MWPFDYRSFALQILARLEGQAKMNLCIQYIRDAGDQAKERLVLKVNSKTDIGDFAIFRAKSDKDGEVYASITDAFWFPDFQAMVGDRVILYTKAGKQSKKDNEDGSTSHFLYWGKTVLWDDTNFAPVLVEIATWEAFIRPE
jgi:hypothetical protein